jgi:hypothetical protein
MGPVYHAGGAANRREWPEAASIGRTKPLRLYGVRRRNALSRSTSRQ